MFIHRLALALHRTVGEIETGMTWRELMSWMRFEATVSPLPDKLADLQNAIACSLAANLERMADSEPFTPRDFLVIKEPPPPDDGLTEIERAMATWRGGG